MHKDTQMHQWSRFSSLEITLTRMVISLLTRVPRQLKGERIIFFQEMVLGQLDIHMHSEVGPLLCKNHTQKLTQNGSQIEM